ncbi:hypothetical protein TWF481_003249 [Arthrobotrys musiformis]|uniref:C2H2-type domain-containing protein n=1 Tax=Arthrobotrys musiformis TaxID=47236 RepID=A0AAV9VQR6_9PEZI
MEAREPIIVALSRVGVETKRLFRDITACVSDGARDGSCSESFKDCFKVEADRFGLWALNLGLFVPDHGSLDYRVRDAETLRDMFRTLLISLNNSLAEVIKYYSSPDNSNPKPAYGVPEDKNLDGEVSGSESSEDGWDEFSQNASSDMQLLLDGIKGTIDRLYKLSIWIRDPSSRSASSKIHSHKHIDPETGVDLLKEFEDFDIDYIRSVFLQYRTSKAQAESPERFREADPDTAFGEKIQLDDSEISLIHRLARANLRRRQRFSYWRRHREKLAQHANFVDTQQTKINNAVDEIAAPQKPNLNISPGVGESLASMPLLGSVTTATQLNFSQLGAFKDSSSIVSVSNYAPSNWLPGEETPGFPEPPAASLLNEFECPFCFTICRKALRSADAWKAHLIHDLQPYVCTYVDCKSGNQLYDSRGEWLQHENSMHRRVFHCALHPEEAFASAGDFEEHIKDGHLGSSDRIPAALLLQASQSTSAAPDRYCPICLRSLETMDSLTKHIALHLERLSLFSFPRDVSNAEVGEEASELSNEANPSFRGSRYEDFQKDECLIFENEGQRQGESEEGPGGSEVSTEETNRNMSDESSESRTSFDYNDYTIGWICALSMYRTAAWLILEEIHPKLGLRDNPNPAAPLSDTDTYTLGRIGVHNIVVACPPDGNPSGLSTIAQSMLSTFTSINLILAIGVGEGVPSERDDIRRGDVVVSWSPESIRLGDVIVSLTVDSQERVITWDGSEYINWERNEFQHLPTRVIEGLNWIRNLHIDGYGKTLEYIEEGLAQARPEHIRAFFLRPKAADFLYSANYSHASAQDTCENCDSSMAIVRAERVGENTMVHFGATAISNTVIKDGVFRDKASKKLGHVLCFDIEGADLNDINFKVPFIFIRGIWGYADSHKDKIWQPYAALAAAGFAKELLNNIPKTEKEDRDREYKVYHQNFPFFRAPGI